MHVPEKQARSMLEEMGKAKPDTPSKRILMRLNSIQTVLEDAEDPTGENASLLKRVFTAVEAGESIEFEGEEAKSKPKPQASANGTPTKEAAVEKAHLKGRRRIPKDEDEQEKPRWSPAEVANEVKQYKKRFKNDDGTYDVKGMLKDAKSFLKTAKGRYAELAQLTLEALRKLSKGEDESEEEGEGSSTDLDADETQTKEKTRQKGGARGRGGSRDTFGNLTNSQGHLINECLGKEPKLLEDIMKECGLPRTRVKSHLNWLKDERGLLTESEEGWKTK